MNKILTIILLIVTIQINVINAGKDKTTKIITNEISDNEEEVYIPIDMNIEEAYEKALDFFKMNEPEKGYKYMEYSSNRDYFYAQINLTYIFMNGYGCEKNLEEALKLCNLVIKRSDKLANKAYQNNSYNKEIHYHSIYKEFKNLWRDIITKFFTDEPETKLDLLSLLSGGQLQLDVENSSNKNKDDEKIPESIRMMYI